MKFKKLSICILFCVSIFSAKAYAEDIYVDPLASSGGTGAKNAPYRTLSEARNKVREINDNMTSDINVILKDGVYVLDETLELTSEDSATNGFKVIYKADDGANPIISGGKTITGWSIYDESKNIWSASVNGMSGRQLYVNGEKAQRARTDGPNELFSILLTTDTGYGLSPEFDGTAPDIMSYRNISLAELIYHHEWRCMRLGIKSAVTEDDTYTLTMDSGFSKLPPAARGNIIAVENAYELLDKPGEWYSDGTTIFYMPREGEDMTDAEVIFPQLEMLVYGNGTQSKTIENIVFDGIEFRYTTWTSPDLETGYLGTQGGFADGLDNESDHKDGLKQAVRFNFGRNIEVKNCTFQGLGCAAIRYGDGTKNSKITNNVIHDVANGGIYLEHRGYWEYDNDSADYPRVISGNEITDNEIYDIGTEYESACGIFCGYVVDTTIAHNELSDLPYTGISIGWGWGNPGTEAKYKTNFNSTNNKVYGNLIHDVMQVMSDGGGIYNLSTAPGMEIYNNVVYNVGAFDGAAYYLDDGSRYVTMYDNIGYNASYALRKKGAYNTIIGNYFDNGVIKLDTEDGDVVKENIIVSDGQYPQSILENAGIRKSEKSLSLSGTAPSSAGKEIAIWIMDGDIVKYADVIALSDAGDFSVTAVGDFEDGKTYEIVLSDGEADNGIFTQSDIPTAVPKKIFRTYISVVETDTENNKLVGKLVGAALNTGDNEELNVIAAVYDENGRFVDMKINKIDENCNLSEFLFDAVDGYTLKLFTWKSMQKATPIESIEIGSLQLKE